MTSPDGVVLPATRTMDNRHSRPGSGFRQRTRPTFTYVSLTYESLGDEAMVAGNDTKERYNMIVRTLT